MKLERAKERKRLCRCLLFEEQRYVQREQTHSDARRGKRIYLDDEEHISCLFLERTRRGLDMMFVELRARGAPRSLLA